MIRVKVIIVHEGTRIHRLEHGTLHPKVSCHVTLQRASTSYYCSSCGLIPLMCHISFNRSNISHTATTSIQLAQTTPSEKKKPGVSAKISLTTKVLLARLKLTQWVDHMTPWSCAFFLLRIKRSICNSLSLSLSLSGETWSSFSFYIPLQPINDYPVKVVIISSFFPLYILLIRTPLWPISNYLARILIFSEFSPIRSSSLPVPLLPPPRFSLPTHAPMCVFIWLGLWILLVPLPSSFSCLLCFFSSAPFSLPYFSSLSYLSKMISWP